MASRHMHSLIDRRGMVNFKGNPHGRRLMMGTIIVLAAFVAVVGGLFAWGKREERTFKEEVRNRPRKAA